MAKRPQDRIASAAEVARELERYLKGEPIRSRPISGLVWLKRWCTRHPALAFLATTTVFALLLGSAISIYFGLLAEQRSSRLAETNTQLEQAEQKARRSADDAQLSASVATNQANIALQALESTLYDLQKVVIDDPAQQEQRRHLLKSVLRGLDNLNADVVSADRIWRCRATAIYGLAEVVHQLGDDSGQSGAIASLPLFEEAINDFQIIFDKNPENFMSALDLVDALSNLGDMLADAGRWQEAQASFQRALPICTKLAPAQPDAPRVQGKLLELEVLSAEAMAKTKKMEEAGVLLEHARLLGRRLIEQFPENAFISGEYGHTLLVHGDWYLKNKDLSAARDSYLEMKSQAKQLIGRFPKHSQALMDLSTALDRLGDLSTVRGDHEAALKTQLESLSIAKSAESFAPDNENIQWDVSFGYQKVADGYLRLKKYSEAREYSIQCVELRQRIARRDSQNSRLHAKLIHALKTLAVSCERLQDVESALKAHRQIFQVSIDFETATGKAQFRKQARNADASVEKLTKQKSEK